jgi:hypothetical protein
MHLLRNDAMVVCRVKSTKSVYVSYRFGALRAYLKLVAELRFSQLFTRVAERDYLENCNIVVTITIKEVAGHCST